MPRWVVAEENEDEASTSDSGSDSDQEELGNEAGTALEPGPSRAGNGLETGPDAPGSAQKRGKISIPLGKLHCHVSRVSNPPQLKILEQFRA